MAERKSIWFVAGAEISSRPRTRFPSRQARPPRHCRRSLDAILPPATRWHFPQARHFFNTSAASTSSTPSATARTNGTHRVDTVTSCRACFSLPAQQARQSRGVARDLSLDRHPSRPSRSADVHPPPPAASVHGGCKFQPKTHRTFQRLRKPRAAASKRSRRFTPSAARKRRVWAPRHHRHRPNTPCAATKKFTRPCRWRVVPAPLAGRDPSTDLAVLKCAEASLRPLFRWTCPSLKPRQPHISCSAVRAAARSPALGVVSLVTPSVAPGPAAASRLHPPRRRPATHAMAEP